MRRALTIGTFFHNLVGVAWLWFLPHSDESSARRRSGDIHDQLALLGQTITNQDYLNTLIASLPCSYDALVSTLSGTSHVTKTKITVDSFKAFLLDKYECCLLREKQDAKKGKGSKDSKDEAFATDSKKKDKHKVECYNCHKCRHVKVDCWAKGGSKEGQGPKQQGRAGNSAALAADKAKDTIEAWVVINRLDLEESRVAIEEVSNPEDFQLTTTTAAGSSLAQVG